MSKLTKQSVPYGMVPNLLLNDNKISLKAKGLFSFMQSKPDGWNFSVEKISFQCKESKSAISEGLRELENFGFLVRKKQQTGSGFVVDYHIYFTPIKKKANSRFPIIGNPIIGKSNIGKSNHWKIGK